MQPLINGFATQWIFSTLIPDTSRFTTLFVQIVRSKWLITIRSFVCRGMISSRPTSPSFLLPLKSCTFTPNNPRTEQCADIAQELYRHDLFFLSREQASSVLDSVCRYRARAIPPRSFLLFEQGNRLHSIPHDEESSMRSGSPQLSVPI